MPSLSDIRDRIKTVQNTRQITRAMKLVAGAKLNKATSAALAAQPFQRTLDRVIRRVVGAVGEDFTHPLLSQPDNDDVVYVVALSADRGLCGNFNSMSTKSAEAECLKHQRAGKTVKVIAYGKKVRVHLQKRGFDVIAGEQDLDPREYTRVSEELALRLVSDMEKHEFSACVLVYNQYKSIMVQEPSAKQILPMELTAPEPVPGEADAALDYLFEPDGGAILAQLLPQYLRIQLFQAFLETQAGEQAKRMTAMDAATRNATELIDSLRLTYNRARQAYITKELIEIVSGAEALNG